jgi:DNA mismatch endonuclease (patch repair protein)
MVDRLTKARRSALMARIGPKDSTIEMAVRRELHARGYRYRLHDRRLPGTPDLVFPSRRAVVFVNGCFWHGHSCVLGRRTPKSRRSYWLKKIDENRARDIRNRRKLRAAGWRVFSLWQCQIRWKQWLPPLRDFLDAQ